MDRTIGPLVARVLLSAIFVWSGLGKLAAKAATIGYIESAGVPMPEIAYYLALLAELGLGGLLLIGLLTRWAALGLAFFSIVSAAMFHANFADQGQAINFMKNLAMAGGLLFAAMQGAGAISVDGIFGKRRAPLRR
ncbi:DoxX family protein [Roseiterribacter gracilis]|uniref:LysR family transcriptional regulator n=1 Tax=Roseiterribacter gracilis TaxID=2812848 RepID=A0A8S8X915_9PROT|nr:LysR family transcriptional regulator [Rhodospirillales bacterium TMPK1]